ncbi:ubiquitin-like protein [Streptomyces sp. NPDC014991]|uniref:ubiquitin-like protein n=1 Tax=Streptomyces sp. NPDC014991 TaxID=3364935 RepID=UPI0036F9A6DC
MQLHVKTMTATVTLEVGSGEAIENIKSRLQDEAGVPPAQQRLLYGGKRLEDGHFLDDYDVPSGGTIEMVLNARG